MTPEQERASLRLVLAIARTACARLPIGVDIYVDRLRTEVERHDFARAAPRGDAAPGAT